jgi:hypothetical protein
VPALFNPYLRRGSKLEACAGVMTLNGGVIIVFGMFTDNPNHEWNKYDPQSVYKKITPNFASESIDAEHYAETCSICRFC